MYPQHMAYKKRDFVPISVTHPELAKEAVGWDPSTLRSGSGKKVTWECFLKHQWDASPSARTRQGQGCPVCSGKKVSIGFNDLLTTRPEVAKDADGWDPKTVTQGSAKKMAWVCKEGHKWVSRVASRSQGQGCPACAGKAIEVGFNDLQTTHPELAKQAHGWDPKTVSFGSDKVREWICTKGHVWTASVMTRSSGNGCSICANKKVLPGYNDLASTNPELAIEAFGWDPTTIFAGSHKKLEWRCSFGHVWSALPNARTSMNSGCPVCDGTKVLVGFNDLASTHPLIAAEADGWDTTTTTRGTQAKRKWKCILGHKWSASPKSRTTLLSGCPTCSVTGFDPNKDGYLYFLYHPHWIMYQIGITNVPEDRLGRHRKLGWELREIRGPLDGFVTRQWEQDILEMLRGKGLKLGSKKGVGKFDGYTEAWDANAFKVDSLKSLMRLVEENE
jgi:hypothetical protein